MEVMLLRRLAYGLAHVPMVIHLLIPVSMQTICQRPLAAGFSSSTACASTCLTWWLVHEKLLGHSEGGSRAHGRVSAGWHTADRLARQRLPECPPYSTISTFPPVNNHLLSTQYSSVVPIIPLPGTPPSGFARRHVADWFHIMGKTLCYLNQFLMA